MQFRYAFVLDADGLKVLDVTFPASPRAVDGATVPIKDARGIYLARTYAYVAAGSEGLAIVDVERPEKPRLEQTWNAGGAINDANDVKLGMTNGSAFAYVADGKERPAGRAGDLGQRDARGLRLQPHGPPRPSSRRTTPTARPSPSPGALDRDRAVDETGNQLGVFGRRGARPFNREEQQRLYLLDGKLFTVRDEAPGPAQGARKAGGSGGH